MVYEKLDGFTVDVEALRNHFLTHVRSLEPVMQNAMFGGWSILSATGSYQDGWQKGHLAFDKDPTTGKMVLNVEKAIKLGIRRASEYKNPTEINHGYLREVMERIVSLNLSPTRARFSLLTAGGESTLHRDAADDVYAVRLHIPIITNPSCTFWCEQGEEHIPANGSVYVLRVNRMHQVFNRSQEDRIHIIMDVTDSTGVTRFHRRDS